MNSKQRRKAYRAMPKAGTQVTWKSQVSDRVFSGVVIGPSDMHIGEHPKAWMCEQSIRKTKSTSRCLVRMPAGATPHVLVSALRCAG